MFDTHGSTLAPTSAPTPTPTARAPRRRPAPRPEPERHPALAHLDVEQLRHLRTVLDDEERRVRYWGRILRGRREELLAGATGARRDDRLARVLDDTTVGAGRQVLSALAPELSLPALPALLELWSRALEGAAPSIVDELVAAEQRLVDYAEALRAHVVAATSDLIARYRHQPGLCLAALPLPPQRRAR